MRPCPICGTSEVTVKWGDANLLSCPTCSLVYTDKLPSLERLEEVYTEDYFTGAEYNDYVAERDALQANFKARIDLLRRYSTGTDLFEIGCAYGFFLDLARQVWQVRGADISADAVAYAERELGLDVSVGSIETLDLPAESFDVIALWDTIEHLHDPVLAVNKIAAALRPGGIVALTTGDIDTPLPRLQKRAWRLYQPNHLYYFSKRSMTEMLNRAGFDVVYFGYESVYRTLREMTKVLEWRKTPAPWRANLLAWVRKGPLMEARIGLNTFDIMLVIAKKRVQPL
jgi:SAM-dependent methyltransferase